MKSYNRGEWSEPYLLLKLIVEQKLYLGKENFEKVEGLFYRIIKILHFEKNNSTQFSFEGDIVIVNSKNTDIRIPIETFIEICRTTFLKIKGVKSRNGSFEMPELMDFLNSINIQEVKSKANSKSDITIQIEDPKTFIAPTLGFSVKSQLGKPSTLLNASGCTNFTYSLSKRLSKAQIDQIENEEIFSEKFKLFERFGVEFIFEGVDDDIFEVNLQTIDFNFPTILSDILLMYYKNGEASENSMEKFVARISEKNEFNYNLNLNSEVYEMIIKRFLVEYALGMRASQVWKRDYQADGGYLIVREDGEVVCYHFYFIKNFENYLFQNTKLETPSRTRYHMAEIFEKDGNQKIRLNLQIRFIK